MKKRVLIVDDELTTCVLLENFLKSEYDVIRAVSGEEALRILKIKIPDVIITDIQMPKMNGFELLKELRLIGFIKHTPIIMLSGNTASKVRIKCYQMGAQDYLTKPFNPIELKEVIKKNLAPINFAKQW